MNALARTLGNGQWDEEEHPRDENGKFTDGGGNVTAPAPTVAMSGTADMSYQEMRARIDKVAKSMDFPPDRIGTHDGDKPFELNGKQYQAAGIAYTSKDFDAPADFLSKTMIVLYNKRLNQANIDGVLTHEIMHIKFETALNRYYKEYDQVMKEPGSDQRGTREDPVMYADGRLKPPYDEKYPAYTAMNAAYFSAGYEGIKDFAAADGVSEYSYEWWLNWKNKGTDYANAVPAGKSAVHETLAEMARIKYETGKFPDHMGERILSWRGEDTPRPSQAQMDKNAKLWRDLHRAVDKVWKLK